MASRPRTEPKGDTEGGKSVGVVVEGTTFLPTNVSVLSVIRVRLAAERGRGSGANFGIRPQMESSEKSAHLGFPEWTSHGRSPPSHD